MMIVALLAFLPTMLFATGGGGGSSTTYYAALKAQVSSSGGGKVYAGTSNSAPSVGSYDATSKQSEASSKTQNDKKTFYAFAQADDGFEFVGWSKSNNNSDLGTGTAVGMAYRYEVELECNSTTSPNATTYYATFREKDLDPFSITFETSANGTYTVDGAAPTDKPVLTKATKVVLASSDEAFLNWVINGTVVSANPYTATCTENTTIGAEFLSSEQVTSANTISELTSALANAAYKKITIPSGITLAVAKGSTVTVPAGKLLVVDGELYVDGSLKVSGTVKGNGKVAKNYITVSQEDTIYEPYGDVKYMKTTTISGSGSITGTIDCETGWSVKVMRGDSVIARSALSSQQPQALVCPVDSAKAINYFTSGTVTGYDTLAKAIMGTGGNASKIAVQLANATMQLSDFPENSGWRATKNSQPQTKLGAKAMRVDSVGFECTTKFEQANSSGTSFACFINCKKFENGSGGYFTNAKGQFINCASVKVSLNLNDSKYTSRAEIYDCGSVTFAKSSGNYDIVGNGGGYFYMSGGPYAGRSGYVNDISKNIRASGGCFTEDPTNYKSTAELQVKKIGDYWYVAESFPEEPVQAMVVKVGESEYPSLEDAITKSASGSVIEVMDSFELSGNIEIPEGKTLEIELAGFNITGNATIVNNGTLIIGDGSVYEEGKGDFAPSIVNNGTLSLCYGDFAGDITLNAGSTTTFYNGNFNGTLTVNDGANVNLLGGCFKQSVEDFLSEGYRELRVGSNYYAGKIFEAAVTDTTKNGYEAAYTLRAVDSEIAKVYGYSNLRSEYTDDDKWYEHAATCASIDPFSSWTIDCTVVFDRATKAGSVNFWYLYDDYLDKDLAAGEVNRCMSPIITAHNSYQISYGRFIHNDPVSSVTVAARNNTGNEFAVNNLGTVCTIEMRIYASTTSDENYLTLAQRKFVLGAGSNKAMIRQEVGAATFYATVTEALAAAADGATVMLTQDCEENVVLAKAGSFTIDQNGFALTGSVTADDNYFVEKAEDGTYTVAKKGIVDENGNAQASIQEVVDAAGEGEKEVTITIPETTTKQTVELPQDTTLTVVQAEGSETVVNVTPAVGYFVEATVVEPTEEQSVTTTVYESKKITEEVVTVTKETVQELNVKLEEFQAGSTETNEVSEVAQIVKAVNNLMENKALERADNVEQAKSETISLKAIVITPKAIVQEVAAESEKVVKAAAFDVTPTDTNDNKIENTSFTFRLPVADGMTGSMVVFHEKVFFGVYPILAWNDGAKLHKYIEITSSEFSEYSYEPRRGVEYAVAKIGDVGYDSLEDAVAAAAAGAKVELLKSTTLTNEIAVAKTVTLDLGEFTVTAASGKSAIQVVADGNLTVQGTGKIVAESTKFALYTDYELSQGAKTITIKGGVFDGAVQFNKYPLHTSATQSGEAAVPTRVTIDGGTFNGRVSIYHAPFTVNGGTFEQGLDTSDGSVTVYANYRTPVTFNGGGFRVRPTPAGSRVVVNGGVYYDNGYFKVGSTAACQATRNGTYYASLAEAFANIGPNTVITVLDGDASSISVALEPGQSLTVPNPFAGTIAGKGGAALDITYDNTSGTATYRVREAGLARIEGTYYPTLQAAFDAAVAGNTVTLLGDATLAFTTLDRAITLDLNGHDVTVTSGAANLSAGALTVVGAGRMTGLVEPSAGKINLVLKGGTYGFNPSKYVPSVIEALPNEKDSLDWSNDRHYVFRNAAFVDGYWTTDSGVWTVVPVPKAYVSRIAEAVSADAGAPLDAAYTFNSFNPDNGDSAIADKVITGDGQLNLNALTDPAEIARALVVLQEAMPFLGWHADFAVSFDKPIAAGSLTLAGQYDGWSSSWVSYSAPNAVAANVIRRLLVDEGGASVNDWSFEHICTKVKVFNCGARQEEDSLAGTTMKVQLRLYAPETDEGTGSPSICICEYKYTFGGKAARIDETLYDTIDAAIAQVKSNDVVVVLNDYTGAVDLNNCDKPFTVNRNGFVLEVTATNNINTAEGADWHFDRLSNGSWSYYNKPAPQSEDVAVVMVEIVDDEGESVSLSVLTPDAEWLDKKTQEGETAEEALAKVEENGLQAWQNYVLGQDPDAAVRVDSEQSPIEATPVVNTLAVNVPADSGFTVKYEIDQVSVNGDLVKEGDQKDSADAEFNIDLSQVTSNAYYKMTAVIESTDGTGAKTKVSSENTIGVLAVTDAPANTIIPVPWSSLADGEEISVSNLVRTATLKAGDNIKAYDAKTGTYRFWTLNENKEWEPNITASGSGSEVSPESDRFTIPRGAGVWLLRGEESTNTVYLVGGVSESDTTSELAAGTGDGGSKPTWNLVGNPTVETKAIPAAGRDGDQIMVPTKGAPRNYTYENGKWYYYETEVVERNNVKVGVRSVRREAASVDIPAGTGFWYLNRGDAANIEW